jgi:hypothetical protein
MLTAGDRGAEKVRLENLVLRHQVMILHRQVKHPVYSRRDRALLLTTYFACSSTVQMHDELAAEAKQLRATQEQPSTRTEYRKMLLDRRRADEALRAAEPRKVGRPPVSDSELHRVARIYVEAYRNHTPPAKAVAQALGLSPSAAAKRVARCRAAGFLGPAEQGKASVGGVLMRRGDAASLASQIAIDEVREQRSRDVPEGVEES